MAAPDWPARGSFSLHSLSLFALTISALFVALVTWASLLHQKDRERQLDRERNEALNHAREARAQSEAATARFCLFETAPHGIVLVNREDDHPGEPREIHARL